MGDSGSTAQNNVNSSSTWTPEKACVNLSDPSMTSAYRIEAIDFFRGLALVFVLVDHIDHMALDGSCLVAWSLMGFGFCDFADVFVFLSGLTVGWVYSFYTTRNGARAAVRKMIVRSAQLLVGYALTSIGVSAIAYLSDIPLVAPDKNLLSVFWLGYQPFTLMILCLYIVLLPTTVAALFVSRTSVCFIFLTSFCVYASVQIWPALNFYIADSPWVFNPFAWQFLMVGAMLIGARLRNSTEEGTEFHMLASEKRTFGVRTRTLGMIVLHRRPPSHKNKTGGIFPLLVTIAVLAFGAFIEKGEFVFGSERQRIAIELLRFGEWEATLTNKTRLAPLRLLNFIALAYVVYRLLPSDGRIWSNKAFRPIMACGRNSLTVYCFGVLLTHLSSIMFDRFGTIPSVVVIVAVDAVIIQIVFAMVMDRWWTVKRSLYHGNTVQ